MPEACDAVAECCADDGSTTSGDFDSCMGGKGLTPPDFASLVPGGLPEELGGEPAAGTDATEAPPAEEEETETTTVPATEAPVPPAATGGGAGRSAGAALAASALVAVACSALVRV